MTRPLFDDPFAVTRVNGPIDFLPEWDVPSVGRNVTDAILTDVERVRKNPAVDPARHIHLLLGQPGYGKSHLFARLQHSLEERAQFVLVSAPKRVTRLAFHAAWQVVETLFQSDGDVAPIRNHLAKLLAPSFLAYFERLPAGLRAKTADLRESLAGDPLTALTVLSPVTELAPYTGLADALRVRIAGANAAVSKALALSLCPAADDARWWLRGEADQVPESRLRALGLPPESPAPAEVMNGVAELLRLVNVPVVLVFDQLDLLLLNSEYGFRELTGELMGWLGGIPNLVIAVGLFPQTMKQLAETQGDGVGAFNDRTRRLTLATLTPEEGLELVKLRMKTWAETDANKPAGWPFDPESVKAFVSQRPTPPRGFIQTCADKFNDWLTTKRDGLIHLNGTAPPPSKAEWFVREWSKLLEGIAKANKSPLEYKEDELWDGVEEALEVARLGKYVPSGIGFTELADSGMQAKKTDPKLDALLGLSCGGRNHQLVVAATKIDSSTAFGGWVKRLEKAMAKTELGGVVIRPRAQLSVGPQAASLVKYKQWVESGRLRVVSLDIHSNLLHQMEGLRQLILRAEGNELIWNAQVIGVDECRRLVVEAGLLANLKLFDFVFKDWPGLTAPTVAPPPAPSPAVAPPPPVAVVPPVPVPPTPVVTPAKPTAKPVSSLFGHLPTPTKITSTPIAPAPAGAQLMAQPQPVVPPPPPPVVPPTAPTEPALPEWVEVMLKKAADYLKKKGQTVHPAGAILGPTFVRLNMEPRGDTDVSKVRREAENLKVQLALEHEPLILSQPRYISIDVQRPDRQTVLLPPLLANAPAKFHGEPAFPVGVGVAGNAEWLNLSDPEGCHLLVAGTTGSGKSEFLKAALAALAARMTPAQVKFRLIDPKRVTFNVAAGCPYLGGPVVYDGEEALPVLEQCVEEMERRYKLLQQRGTDHVRHLTGADAVPRWVVVMDEFADLMTDKNTKKELEPLLKRLGAKARAAGIHLILGTQRPDASVVTPLLRANLPGKIGLMVGSEKESKLFLDEPDAAYLFGKGDLVWKRGGGLVRLQSPFVPQAEFLRHLRAG